MCRPWLLSYQRANVCRPWLLSSHVYHTPGYEFKDSHKSESCRLSSQRGLKCVCRIKAGGSNAHECVLVCAMVYLPTTKMK